MSLDGFYIRIPRETAQTLLPSSCSRRKLKEFMWTKVAAFLPAVYRSYTDYKINAETVRVWFANREDCVRLNVSVVGYCRFSETHAAQLRLVSTLYLQWFLGQQKSRISSIPGRGCITLQLIYDIEAFN